MEAAGLLRLLYEREYGTLIRKESRDQEATEARMARDYQKSIRQLPRDPNYRPES